MTFVGLLFVLTGGFGVLLGMRMLRARRRYVLTRGVVVSVRRSGSSNRTVRFPTVRFTDTRERVHEVEVPVGTSWERRSPGQAYDLYFDPEDPSTVLPRSRSVDYVSLAGMGFFLVAGFVMLLAGRGA